MDQLQRTDDVRTTTIIKKKKKKEQKKTSRRHGPQQQRSAGSRYEVRGIGRLQAGPGSCLQVCNEMIAEGTSRRDVEDV